MTWDDLSKMTNDELFDEIEYRLDEAGCRFLNILRGRFMSVEMEVEQKQGELAQARHEAALKRAASILAECPCAMCEAARRLQRGEGPVLR